MISLLKFKKEKPNKMSKCAEITYKLRRKFLENAFVLLYSRPVLQKKGVRNMYGAI